MLAELLLEDMLGVSVIASICSLYADRVACDCGMNCLAICPLGQNDSCRRVHQKVYNKFYSQDLVCLSLKVQQKVHILFSVSGLSVLEGPAESVQHILFSFSGPSV